MPTILWEIGGGLDTRTHLVTLTSLVLEIAYNPIPPVSTLYTKTEGGMRSTTCRHADPQIVESSRKTQEFRSLYVTDR